MSWRGSRFAFTQRMAIRYLWPLLATAVVAELAVACGGSPMSAQIGSVDTIDRSPSKTIWAGVYVQADADRGEVAFAQRCAGCHGADLRGNGHTGPIVGQPFFDRWLNRRLSDPVVFIQTVPHTFASLVPTGTTLDIMAFILAKNDVPPGHEHLPGDHEGLSRILITVPPAR
jgi:hypothetical protein